MVAMKKVRQALRVMVVGYTKLMSFRTQLFRVRNLLFVWEKEAADFSLRSK